MSQPPLLRVSAVSPWSSRFSLPVLFALGKFLLLSALLVGNARAEWVGTWVSAQQVVEPHNMPPAPGLAGNTLRQIIHPTLTGTQARVTFSNVFGAAPLTIEAASLARAADGAAIQSGSARPLTFSGESLVTIPTGASVVSDALDFPVQAFERLSISMRCAEASTLEKITGHPGSRTTSFIHVGDGVMADDLPGATPTDRWYFITAVDVWTDQPARAIVVLGDSITDGRGSTTNKNDRWPDNLARRLHAAGRTDLAVLNQGIGGNRMVTGGIGPSALQRFDRDVLVPPGVKWLMVAEGINDVGSIVSARKNGDTPVTAKEITACYEQFIIRAHAKGLKVIGSTLMPFEGFAAYHTPETESVRQAVNAWIRTSGKFDAVVDFDALARDPKNPAGLRHDLDSGDRLHLSAQGYRVIAEGIDLALFK